MPEIVEKSIQETNGSLNIIVLGSGNQYIENSLKELQHKTNAGADDAVFAIKRALHIYSQKELMKGLIYNNMSFDFSWEKSAKNYLELYHY